MQADIEESAWPIVTVRWKGVVSDATLLGFLTRLNAWLDRGERFGLLIDGTGASGLSPDQRKVLLTHMKQHAARTEKLLIQAAVIDNIAHRTLFYGINLFFPNPFPSKVFAEPVAARAWLEAQLSAR